MGPESFSRRLAAGRDAAWALLVAALFFFSAGVASGETSLWIATVVTESALLAAVVAVVFLRRLDARDAFFLRSPGWVRWIVVLAGAAALHLVLREVAPLIQQLLEALGLGYGEELRRWEERLEQETHRAPLALFLSATIVPAVCEESLFRGVILAGWRRSRGPAAALLLTSGLFALIHVVPIRMVITFTLGLWFGAAVLATGSIWCGVSAHMLNNVLALALPEGDETNVWVLSVSTVLFVFAAWGLRRLKIGRYDQVGPRPP
ncbi:MAG: CPBP family intramembrane metalloprotease [Planctomycetes bacterium]|nr:CPBP family intramembrane metalloprotease [Planctomycetota bacterium]